MNQPRAADFILDGLKSQPRDFRFLGWRDDHAAFYLLDEHDAPWVIEPELYKPENPIRYPEPPIAIREMRLLPPPCRRTRAGANLIRNLPSLCEGKAVSNYQGALEVFRAEAARLGIEDSDEPDPWEMIYGDALYPKKAIKPEDDWQATQEKLWQAWAASHGWTLESMEANRTKFIRRHKIPTGNVDVLFEHLARIRFTMEFTGLEPVWLVGFRLRKPMSATDDDQIKALLAALPSMVILSPEEVEARLGITSDRKHRTLHGYCELAGLAVENLTAADLPALRAAAKGKRENQSLAAKIVNKQRRSDDQINY